ncbi:hypothetical protein EST38_g6436 [Candolleomyces aberdarensis]|uniref:Uncharacterized protein n=1 Tax=Candolleomyces aberdarensis TaxID=2316362 RepID=A0A4Q2DHU4_9AGAR|nr:hypothetical protein EST38_g6436 [Candolleomyces aberdarensis]
MDWDEIYDHEQAQGVQGDQSFFESGAGGASSSRRPNDALAGMDDDDNMDDPMGGIVQGKQPAGGGGMGLRRGGAGRGDLFSEDDKAGTPLEKLTRHWVNERYAPDILPAQEELLGGLLDHLRVQVFVSIPVPSTNLSSYPLPFSLLISLDTEHPSPKGRPRNV